MNREIEFRAWTCDEMVFSNVDGDKYKKSEYLSLFFKNHGFHKLMQYIGLKDKKGKKIFEGDIIKLFDTWTNIVKFKNGSFYYKATKYHEISFFENNNLNIKNGKASNIEVIGNIFENLELLEDK